MDIIVGGEEEGEMSRVPREGGGERGRWVESQERLGGGVVCQQEPSAS